MLQLLIAEGRAWVEAQRRRYREECECLPPRIHEPLRGFFRGGTLDRIGFCVVRSIENPPFYDGLARAVYPSHTIADGDTVFSLATGRFQGNAEVSIVGALAADALAEAIVRAAVQATGAGGLPAARDLHTVPARFK